VLISSLLFMPKLPEYPFSSPEPTITIAAVELCRAPFLGVMKDCDFSLGQCNCCSVRECHRCQDNELLMSTLLLPRMPLPPPTPPNARERRTNFP